MKSTSLASFSWKEASSLKESKSKASELKFQILIKLYSNLNSNFEFLKYLTKSIKLSIKMNPSAGGIHLSTQKQPLKSRIKRKIQSNLPRTKEIFLFQNNSALFNSNFEQIFQATRDKFLKNFSNRICRTRFVLF